MKKKLITILLCFCLCLSCGTIALAEGEDDGTAGEGEGQQTAAPQDNPLTVNANGEYEIGDRAALNMISQDLGGKYILTADIDMSDETWTPQDFHGSFNGDGHTIFNLKVNAVSAESAKTADGNHKEYDTYFAAFFANTKDATIENLNILNADIRVETEENCFAAILAGYIENTTIKDCSVNGRVYLYTTNTMCGVSGVAGFGTGTISSSKADVTLVYVDKNEEKMEEEFLGAILACGYADIENCEVTIDGYASVHGYVHNGGVVGMYHVHDKGVTHKGYVKGCTVKGNITFFEHNKDRRAYCKAVIGENLHSAAKMSGNTTKEFKGKEIKKYTVTLLPEMCENPQYTEELTEGNCTDFGYTTYTCPECKYSYRDKYTAPQHTWTEGVVTEPTCTEQGYTTYTCTLCGYVMKSDFVEPAHKSGDWKTISEPSYDAPGAEGAYCTVCGELVEQREIPALIHASACVLNTQTLALTYKDTAMLSVDVQPQDASDKTVKWSSSDENVVTVDVSGNVVTTGRGSAVISAVSGDGVATGTCNVTVSYSWWQWIIEILLFGWIWY